MKRKVKRYDEGGGVEEMKKGIFSSKEDKEQEDSRSTYFKSPSSTRATLPSEKESTGTSYNTEYKEEKKYGVGPHGAFAGIHKTLSDFHEKRMPKKMASGGKTSSASSRGDGCAQRGKTRGKMV